MVAASGLLNRQAPWRAVKVSQQLCRRTIAVCGGVGRYRQHVDRLADAELTIKALLEAFGVDEGDHTANTPARIARARAESLSGCRENPADHRAATFSAPENPGLVVVESIAVTSTCAHQLLPFTGQATIAYRPHPGQNIVVPFQAGSADQRLRPALADSRAHRSLGRRGDRRPLTTVWGDVPHHCPPRLHARARRS
jgi:GTP cyclohydrolase I